MDVLLTKDQIELKKMVRDFAVKEIIPVAAEYDKKGEFPRQLYQKAVDMGLTLLTFPEELGGAGLTQLDEALVCEEVGYGDGGMSAVLGACSLASIPVLHGGNDKQRQQIARVLLDGGLLACCITEPESGSDAASMRTSARREGDGYVINGAKCFITNGGVAGIYVVFATMDRSLGARGISAFLVERNRPGVSTGKEEDKMGIRLSNTCDVIFEDVHIPASNLIGKEGHGFPLLMDTLNRTRAVGGASAVGICQRALDLCIAYAKERKTFGRPIAANQAIQFMLADMEILTQAARHLAWTGARALDAGVADASFGAAAKTFCSDAAMKITTDAVQIFGGYGYSREYPVEKLMRDAKIFQIFEGTNQVQRIVIAGSLLK